MPVAIIIRGRPAQWSDGQRFRLPSSSARLPCAWGELSGRGTCSHLTRPNQRAGDRRRETGSRLGSARERRFDVLEDQVVLPDARRVRQDHLSDRERAGKEIRTAPLQVRREAHRHLKSKKAMIGLEARCSLRASRALIDHIDVVNSEDASRQGTRNRPHILTKQPTYGAQLRRHDVLAEQVGAQARLGQPPETGKASIGGFSYAPGEIRTPDLRFRRPTLYPAELQAQNR
jgi:hypothetical protein